MEILACRHVHTRACKHGRPAMAFDCFQVALRLHHSQPRLWLRLSECCIAHREALVSPPSTNTHILSCHAHIQTVVPPCRQAWVCHLFLAVELFSCKRSSLHTAVLKDSDIGALGWLIAPALMFRSPDVALLLVVLNLMSQNRAFRCMPHRHTCKHAVYVHTYTRSNTCSIVHTYVYIQTNKHTYIHIAFLQAQLLKNNATRRRPWRKT